MATLIEVKYPIKYNECIMYELVEAVEKNFYPIRDTSLY